jgi:hypothetical protein
MRARVGGLHRKYEAVPDLLMVYVWNVRGPIPVEIYAMTYSEAFSILKTKGHTLTASWTKKNGGYTIPNVNGSLKERLQEYRMGPGKWRDRLTRI